MGQPERKASSTRRTPSTPTKPPSFGKPPRSAMRNSLSQRLSRLVRRTHSPAGRASRAALLGVAIAWRLANFVLAALKSRASVKHFADTLMSELDARADRSGYLALGSIFFANTFWALCRYSYSGSRLEFCVCPGGNVGLCFDLAAIHSPKSCEWRAFLPDAF